MTTPPSTYQNIYAGTEYFGTKLGKDIKSLQVLWLILGDHPWASQLTLLGNEHSASEIQHKSRSKA